MIEQLVDLLLKGLSLGVLLVSAAAGFTLAFLAMLRLSDVYEDWKRGRRK